MEAAGADRTVLGLETILLLLHVGAAGGCAVSVSQPALLEVDYTQGAVTVPCSFSTVGCPPMSPTRLWFRLGAQRPESLCVNGQCSGQEGKFTVAEDLARSQISLTVSGVTPNDSAIYICGIASPSSPESRAKQTGAGTVLVVRETKLLTVELQSLLIVVVTLLSIYIVGLLVVFVILSKSKSNALRKRATEDSQKKSARRIFQEIAQELYSKRHMGTSQQSEKDNSYENRRARYTCERP